MVIVTGYELSLIIYRTDFTPYFEKQDYLVLSFAVSLVGFGLYYGSSLSHTSGEVTKKVNRLVLQPIAASFALLVVTFIRPVVSNYFDIWSGIIVFLFFYSLLASASVFFSWVGINDRVNRIKLANTKFKKK
jgi:hypothetical protein